MKISLYLLLCLASFIITFNNRKDALKNAKTDAKSYNEHLKNKDLNDAIRDLENKNKDSVLNESPELNNVKKGDVDFDKLEKEKSKNFFYRFFHYNLRSKFVKLSNFILDKDGIISDIFNLADDVCSCIMNKGKIPERCLRFEYPEMREIFNQKVRILATNKIPSILNLVAYSKRNKTNYLFVENKGKQTLESAIKKHKLSGTDKLIVAFGVAKALQLFHKNNIVVRNLNTSNIVVDQIYRPYLSDFSLVIQTDSRPSYFLCAQTLKSLKKNFIPPELKTKNYIVPASFNPKRMPEETIVKYIKNQSSTKIDVYSYGAVLYVLMTGNDFPDDDSFDYPKNVTLNG